MITHPGMRYLAMLAALSVATLVRFVLLPAEVGLPFLTYFPALVLVATVAGLGPGTAFIALSMLLGNYLFILPLRELSLSGTPLLACAAYALSSAFILAVLVSYQRKALRQSRQLAEASAMLSEAQEIAHLGSFGFEVDTRRILWSEEECRIYGRDPGGPAPSYAEMLAECIHPDDAPLLDGVFSRALQTRSVYELEHRILRPDGSVRWVHNRARPCFDDEGRLLRYVGATQDITERKRAEETLRASEARYRGLFGNIVEMVTLFAVERDEEGQIVERRLLDANPAFLQAVGAASADDVLGKTSGELFGQDWSAQLLPVIRDAMATGQVQGLEVCNAETGRHYVISVVRLDSDLFLGTGRDITGQKLAAAQLARASQILSEAQKIAHVGSFEYIAATRTTLWSEEEYRIYGLDPAGPSPAYDVLLARCIHPDDAAQLDRVFTEALQTRSVYELEYRILRPDGSVRWVCDRAQPYFDEQGRLLRYIGATQDITGRKEAEAALRAATDEAERANRAKSRFLAAASHDLRQPLAALSIYANSLGRHVVPEGRPMLSNLQDCVASMSELLSDLLDLSKLEAGVVEVDVQDFALGEILPALMAAHAPEAILKGLDLRSRPSARMVRTDPVLLGRIIGNFLANAVHYTERGGVLLACRRHAGKDWLEVWDTGIGIANDKIPEIFQEFKQLGDEARTRGSGLGLAIVARMAKLLGLEIRVRSRPGKGSLFAIELPPGQGSPTPAAVESPLRHALRIALVEDNPAVRDALVMGLQGAGHQLCAAPCGGAVMELLAGTAPDIVVSDYRLQKGETGFQVIAAARQRFGHDLPALLITGDTDPALLRSMADRGIVVLHKPVDLQTLLRCLEDATASRRT